MDNGSRVFMLRLPSAGTQYISVSDNQTFAGSNSTLGVANATIQVQTDPNSCKVVPPPSHHGHDHKGAIIGGVIGGFFGVSLAFCNFVDYFFDPLSYS